MEATHMKQDLPMWDKSYLLKAVYGCLNPTSAFKFSTEFFTDRLAPKGNFQ